MPAECLPDYRVTCILVERGHRGQGLASIALHGAVELIAQAGGGAVMVREVAPSTPG